jgi:uncharacterized protein
MFWGNCLIYKGVVHKPDKPFYYNIKRLYFCSMSILENNIEKIRDLCFKHKVTQLFVFGSVLTDKFKKTSDIDMLVDFADVDLYEYADNYFDLKYSLEKLLKREVDLLENKAIKNPFLRQSIDSSKQLIYGE